MVAPPASWAPHWDDRDVPPSGTFANGTQAGNVTCSPSPCVPSPGLPLGWFVYDVAHLSERLAWYGTAIDSKRDAAGTHYRRNRVYDPATGRFTQEDPIGLAGGINLYGYANGDPANLSDPFGLCPMCVVGAVWALYEIGSGVYDVYNAAKTVADPNASTGEKVTTVALAGVGLFAPGGGYSSLGKLQSVGAGTWKSTAGLIYGADAKFGNRVQHVLAHTAPDATKKAHSVFSVPRNQVLGLVDEAWLNRGAAVAGDRGTFVVNMGRRVGTAGEQSIRIVTQPGTSRIITAYPVP